MSTEFRRMLEECEQLWLPRDQALLALLDAGLTSPRIARLHRGDVVRVRGELLGVRLVDCRTCEQSRRTNPTYRVLDALQSAYVRRWLDLSGPAESAARLFPGRLGSINERTVRYHAAKARATAAAG